MIKVLFICHGNICRSPMAEFVMKDIVRKANLSDDFEIASAATSREELGNPVHPGTRRKLAQYGISTVGKYARQMTLTDYAYFDYLIGMDDWNIKNMLRITGGDPEGKICKLLSFAGKSGDIADPWYTGDFDETYRDVLEGCQAAFEQLRP
jgi:protein-tyrosine phosphatase